MDNSIFSSLLKKVNSKNLLKLEILIACLVVNFFAFLFSKFNIEGYTLSNGFMLSGLYFSIFLLSFIIEFKNYTLKRIILSLYGLSILIVLFIAFINDFDTINMVAFLFVFTFFSVSQDSIRSHLLISISVFIVLTACLIFLKEKEPNSIALYLASFLIISFTGIGLTYSRSHLRKTIGKRQNLLEHIFNNSTDGLILLDMQSKKVIDLNKLFAEIINVHDAKELIGTNYERLKVGTKYIFKIIDFTRAVSIELADKRVLNINSKLITYDGKELILASLKSFKNREVLERSFEVDRLVKISEESYKYLFDESSSLICLLNRAGEIVDVNKATIDLTGYSKEILLGKNYSFLDFDEKYSIGRDEINEKAWLGEKQTIEKAIKDIDGKRIDIEVIIQKGKYFNEEVLICNSRNISERINLQKEIKKNYDRFTALFELSPVAIAVSSMKGEIIDFNKSFIKLLEYTPKELKELTIKDISHPDDMETNLLLRKNLLEKGKASMEMKKRYLSKSGKIISTYLNVVLQNDEKGNPAFFLGQIIDISDIEAGRKKLEESERSYRDLFDNSYDLLYIINRENKIIDVNNEVIKKYGYSKEEIISGTPEIFAAPELNDIEIITKRMLRAWDGEDQTVLWWSKKKNNEIFPKDLNFRKGMYNGEEVLIATGRDISESYNYEKELEKKEKRYRDLFERNLAGVYRTNREGLILECNEAFARIFGYLDPNKIKNIKYAVDFYKSAEEREALMKELDKNDFVEGKQIQLIKKNGDEIIALLNVSKISKEEGEEYFEGNLFDISELYKAQELLKESEKKYKQLVDNSSYGVVILDRTDKVLFTNEKALKILYSDDINKSDELSINQLFASNNLNSFNNINNYYIKNNRQFVEIQTSNKNNKELYLEVNPSSISFENKECIQLSFTDISDKKRAELESEKARTVENYNRRLQAELDEKEKAQKRLVDAQSYMAGIIESSIDMIFTTDINGNINKLNSAALNKLSYLQSNVVGKPLELLFENEEKGKEIIHQLRSNNSFSGEVRMKRNDGSSFLAFSSITNLYNAEGVVLGIMGVSRDITDIKKKETEIREQAAKLNAIIESSSHFFFTINRDFLITSFNELFKEDLKKYMNYEVKENESFLNIISLFSEDKKEKSIESWKKKLQGSFLGVSNSFEIKGKDVFGKPYYREVFLDPIQSEDERIEEVSGIGHDITEKKISEEELKSSLKEKDVLLKEVHHRVKNNMQVISSILNLQSSYISDEKVLSILRESQNRIKSMAIIHEKLYRTKDFSSIKFSEYVENLAESIVRTYEYNEAEIEIVFNLEEVLLNLDMAIPCGLIINELISNSLKYAFNSNEKGKIEINLSESNEEVKLQIADNGVGIPKEINFKKTETLGLQLVNTLTQQLEGTIELEVDKGTKFKLNFKKQI